MATSEMPMTPETARAILKLSISEHQRKRMKDLLGKAKAGTLSRKEALELDKHGNILSVLKAKARRILKSAKSQ